MKNELKCAEQKKKKKKFPQYPRRSPLPVSWPAYLGGVVPFQLSVRRGGRRRRRFVVLNGPGDELLNAHDSVGPQALLQIRVRLKEKKNACFVAASVEETPHLGF